MTQPKSGISIGDSEAIDAAAAVIGGPDSSSGRDQQRMLKLELASPDPCKRGRKILGIGGRKQAKRFRRNWRRTFEAITPSPTKEA